MLLVVGSRSVRDQCSRLDLFFRKSFQLGCYGHASPKPTRLEGTFHAIADFDRWTLLDGEAPERLTYTDASGGVHGNKDIMSNSSEYPIEFVELLSYAFVGIAHLVNR